MIASVDWSRSADDDAGALLVARYQDPVSHSWLHWGRSHCNTSVLQVWRDLSTGTSTSQRWTETNVWDWPTVWLAGAGRHCGRIAQTRFILEFTNISNVTSIATVWPNQGLCSTPDHVVMHGHNSMLVCYVQLPIYHNQVIDSIIFQICQTIPIELQCT